MNARSSDDRLTVIVGAGITGLTAAYTLANAGEKCLLLERKDTVGGDCRSFTIDDITFDLGPHVLVLNPDVEEGKLLLTLLENEDVITRQWQVAFHAKGKLWKFPPGLRDLLSYPRKYLLEILLARLRKNAKKSSDRNSLQHFIEEKTGPSYYQDLFSSFILKKTGIEGDTLHHDWFLRTDRSVRNRKEISQKAMRLKSWYYPAKGFEAIPEKLWGKYKLLGGETMFNCGPISIEKSEGRVISVTAGEKTFLVKNMVWTASVNELNQLLDPNIPPISYLDTLIICLTYNRNKRVYRPFLYTYHPSKDLIFNRIYYPDNIFGDRSRPEKEGICLELNNFSGLNSMSDIQIVEQAINDVDKLRLYGKSELRLHRLFRLKECMPVYGLDYEKKLMDTFATIHRFGNLFSVGRKGGYFFCQTPASVKQGLKIAKHLLKK